MGKCPRLLQCGGMDTTANDAVRQGERTESETWQRVWEMAPAPVRDALGLSWERDGQVLVCRAGRVPNWFFNRLVGLGLDAPARRDEVDGHLDRFFESGVPFGVSVVSSARPHELPGWLEARGLARTTTLARMVRTTDDLPEPESDVVIRVVGREDAVAWGETVVRGFALPPLCASWMAGLVGRDGWRVHLAYESGEPVAAGALCVHGKVGWLGFGCTLPKSRGRGIHRAMMLRRMMDAADLGCRWLQTETNLAVGDEPTPSLDNMKRLGFQMAYERPNYVFTPST